MAKITTHANGIRSQKRTKISLSNNQRIGASNSRRQRRKFQRSDDGAVSSLGFTSWRNSRRAMKVAPASRIEIISATRTPGITPKRSIKIPPISGATIIGTRVITIGTPIPIEDRVDATVAPTGEKVAGSEQQVQERDKITPAMSPPHCGVIRKCE